MTTTTARADATCPASIERQYVTVREVASTYRGRYGAVCAVKRFAYRVARRLFKLEIADLLSLDFRPLHQRPLESSSLEFRFLSVDDIRTAAGDSANDLDVAMAGRLEFEWNFCFAAFNRGRLVNYSWYALHHVEPEHSFGASLTLPDDTIYMHKAFTLPAYRGRRLHQATVHRATQIFARMGIRRLVALIEYANWASVRSHERLGCQRIGRFWRLGHKLIARRYDSSVTGLGFGKDG
ncbi:MAG: GNAT family N-acetyltransferase [Pirellulales bacterium]